MITDRPDHVESTSLPAGDPPEQGRSRTLERFSDAEMAEIKKGFAKRF